VNHKGVTKMEPRNTVKVLITEPDIITNEDKRIVRLIYGSKDDQWDMVEVLTRESGDFNWETKILRLSDEEWQRVTELLQTSI
jgi:uncharacterized protein YrzB (UPF0473 family)